jgi:hypothetical protein
MTKTQACEFVNGRAYQFIELGGHEFLSSNNGIYNVMMLLRQQQDILV